MLALRPPVETGVGVEAGLLAVVGVVLALTGGAGVDAEELDEAGVLGRCLQRARFANVWPRWACLAWMWESMERASTARKKRRSDRKN